MCSNMGEPRDDQTEGSKSKTRFLTRLLSGLLVCNPNFFFFFFFWLCSQPVKFSTSGDQTCATAAAQAAAVTTPDP